MPAPDDFSNEYSDTFAKDIAGEIGASLFSKGAKDETSDLPSEIVNEGEVTPPAAAAPKPETPPETPPVDPAQNVVPGQNSVGKPLPKSWKKDIAPLWEKADPALHEYVYTREADMMRGIQQYAQGHQQWNNLIQPFAPIFQQHPDVQPVQVMQGLMNTHLQLLNPSIPPDKKLEMAKEILSSYGIEFGDPANQPQAPNPQIAQLEARLRQMEASSRQAEERAFAAGVAEQERAVQSFATDPKNEFFSEVQNDILRFIQTGAAQDLPQAYELACYANPAVRAKLLAKQQVNAPVPPAPPRKANGQFVNIDSEVPKPPRTRTGTMDDTINSVIAQHYPKH